MALWNKARIEERLEANELIGHIDSKRKQDRPLIDHNGKECWWTDLLFVVDPRYLAGDYRREVARKVNRHRSDDGTICGSGKWDPGKARLQIDGIMYARYETKGGRSPHCELCEGGDCIPVEKRFFNSEYKPDCDNMS